MKCHQDMDNAPLFLSLASFQVEVIEELWISNGIAEGLQKGMVGPDRTALLAVLTCVVSI